MRKFFFRKLKTIPSLDGETKKKENDSVESKVRTKARRSSTISADVLSRPKPLPKMDPIDINGGNVRRDTIGTISSGSFPGSSLGRKSQLVGKEKPVSAINYEVFKYGMPSVEIAEDVESESASYVGDMEPDKAGDAIPTFINKNNVIFSGFGGWVAKKKLRNQTDTHYIVVKTFKREDSADAATDSFSNESVYDWNCKNEYLIMQKLKNRNIVPVYNLCKDYWGSSYYWSLVIPYYRHGDMFSLLVQCEKKKKLDDFTPKITENFFKQMVSAVEFLHSKDIVHCDIKLDNFLIDDNFTIKLTDFGMSVDAKTEIQEMEKDEIPNTLKFIDVTKIGTKSYRAPELFLPEKKHHFLEQYRHNDPNLAEEHHQACKNFYRSLLNDLKKLDVWALAVCYLYLSFKLHKPWDFADKHADEDFGKYFVVYKQSEFLKTLPLNNDNDLNTKINNLISHNDCLNFVKRLPFDSRCIILKMLNVDCALRLNIEDVAQNQWINNISFCSAEEFNELFCKIFSGS